jgi:uroporphyrinogen-III synthase
VFEIEYLNPPLSRVDYDAVIFSSKNAVIGIDKIWDGWKKRSLYSIGEGTSEIIKKLGGIVSYEAKSSYGDKFAFEIAPLLKDKRALLPRAFEVASDIAGILRERDIGVEELVVYKTKSCKNAIDIPQRDAILIFTSPSSVKYFLNLSNWSGSFTAVAIGKKTAAAFPSQIKPLISPKQTIKSCVDFAKTLSKNYI